MSPEIRVHLLSKLLLQQKSLFHSVLNLFEVCCTTGERLDSFLLEEIVTRLSPDIERSIAQVLELTVDEAIRFFLREDRLGKILWQI